MPASFHVSKQHSHGNFLYRFNFCSIVDCSNYTKINCVRKFPQIWYITLCSTNLSLSVLAHSLPLVGSTPARWGEYHGERLSRHPYSDYYHLYLTQTLAHCDHLLSIYFMKFCLVLCNSYAGPIPKAENINCYVEIEGVANLLVEKVSFKKNQLMYIQAVL